MMYVQLQNRFEQLKRLHQDERSSLEEKRKDLQEEINAFSKRKAAAELLQGQAFGTVANSSLKKDRKT